MCRRFQAHFIRACDPRTAEGARYVDGIARRAGGVAGACGRHGCAPSARGDSVGAGGPWASNAAAKPRVGTTRHASHSVLLRLSRLGLVRRLRVRRGASRGGADPARVREGGVARAGAAREGQGPTGAGRRGGHLDHRHHRVRARHLRERVLVRRRQRRIFRLRPHRDRHVTTRLGPRRGGVESGVHRPSDGRQRRRYRGGHLPL